MKLPDRFRDTKFWERAFGLLQKFSDPFTARVLIPLVLAYLHDEDQEELVFQTRTMNPEQLAALKAELAKLKAELHG